MADENQKHRMIDPEDLIVSKTDLQGKITYCNAQFMIYSGYYLEELIGKDHVSTKHSDMPKSIYRYLWKELKSINEVSCIIKNQTKDGAYYWSYMNATPSFDADSNHIGYLFVQRSASTEAIDCFDGLYREMVITESQYQDDDEAMDASYQLLDTIATSQGGHNEFVFSHYV